MRLIARLHPVKASLVDKLATRSGLANAGRACTSFALKGLANAY